MTVRRALWLGLAALIILLSARAAGAGPPHDQLKGAIDRVVATLDSPALKGEGKVLERRTAVRKIANEIFDFGEIARRSLGRYWQPLSEPQRAEFVGLFGDLLERSYISKIELYGGENVGHSGERVDAHPPARRTRLMTQNGTGGPVDFQPLHRRDPGRVYAGSRGGLD